MYYNFTTSGPSCSLPSFPQSLPLPVCPSTSNATLEDAKAIAWQYAPVVYTHPLERYHLQSPDIWYNKSELFLWDVRPEGNSTYDGIQTPNRMRTNIIQSSLLLPRSFVSLLNSTQLSEEERSNLLKCAPFDENGLSTANVYYTVADFSPSLWLFTYHLYYAWNGCSNQAFVLNLDGELQQLDYLMCPTGVHESDWCRVSVLVCKSDGALMQAAYSQHAWMETRDCQAGQCPLEDGHPVAYAGLDGHGNYFQESNLTVYAAFNGSSFGNGFYASLDNFGGVFIGDRTKRDPSKKFLPTQDNIKYLPTTDEIFAENKTEEFGWALYSGQWGAPLADSPIYFECLAGNGTFIKCPDTQVYNILSSVIKVTSIVPFIQNAEFAGLAEYYVISPGNASFTKYPDIVGPLYRTYTYQWLPQHPAPIFSDNLTLLVCPDDVIDLKPIPIGKYSSSGISSVVDYLWGVALGMVVFSIVMIVLLWLPVVWSPHTQVRQLVAVSASSVNNIPERKGYREEEEEEEAQDAVRLIHAGKTNLSRRSIIWALLGTCILIPGFVLSILGWQELATVSVVAVTAEASGFTITGILRLLLAIGLLLLIILDTTVIIIVFFSDDEYVHIGTWRMRNYLGGRKWLLKRSFYIHLGCAGFMLLTINISALLFSLGWIMAIAHAFLREICNDLSSVTVKGINSSEVCVSIPVYSKDPVCGWQILSVCQEYTSLRVQYITLGGILLLWAHLVFFIMLMMSLSRFYSYKVTWNAATGKGESAETASRIRIR